MDGFRVYQASVEKMQLLVGIAGYGDLLPIPSLQAGQIDF
jgi:hypothetical protein